MPPPDTQTPTGSKSQLERQKSKSDPDYFANNFGNETFYFEDAALPPMIFSFLSLIDLHGTGKLTGHDLELAADIFNSTQTAVENNSPELSYKHLPESVANVLKEYDQDQSGSVGLAELMSLDAAMKKVKNENRMVKKLLIGTVIVILILMAGMFGLSFTAAEMAKEMRGGDSGVMKTSSGTVASMGGVKEEVVLADFVYLEPQKLKLIKDIGFTHGGVYYFYNIEAFELNQDSKKLDLTTSTGTVLTIQETAKSSVSVQFQKPGQPIVMLEGGGGGRRLADGKERRLFAKRRLFGGGLVTSGSFSMMASTGM